MMEIKSCNVNRILPLILSLLLLMLSSPVVELKIFERKILTCYGQKDLSQNCGHEKMLRNHPVHVLHSYPTLNSCCLKPLVAIAIVKNTVLRLIFSLERKVQTKI